MQEAPPSWKRHVFIALAGAALLVAAVVGYLVISRTHRPAPAATDDFDAAFSARGIYGGTRQ